MGTSPHPGKPGNVLIFCPSSRVEWRPVGSRAIRPIQQLCARTLAGGPQCPIIGAVVARAFYPVEDGIYHIARADEDAAHPLRFFDFAAGKSRLLARIEGQLSMGLTVSPDRKTVLYCVGKPLDFDLMLIENLR